MHNEWDENGEDWEEFPDDWFDGADEILRSSHIMLLEMCFSKPSAIKGENKG